jgi:hypothetical protein
MVITRNKIEQVYQYARRIYCGEITREAAVAELRRDYQWNEGSAKDYIRAYLQMRSGGEYKRNINSEATEYFLEHIYNEDGYDELQTALRAVAAHLAYQEDYQTHGNIHVIYNRFRNMQGRGGAPNP